MSPRANHACLSCAQHKRKCDRAVPSCSTCVKQKRQCWYYRSSASAPAEEGATSQMGLPSSSGLMFMAGPRQDASLHPQYSLRQAAILPLASHAVRVVGACLQCRSQKRKCDKILPTCSRCSRQHTRCVYPKQIIVSNDPGASFLHSLDISRLDATVPLPVESRPHMPMLIHSFIETFGMEPLPVDSSSLAMLLRAAWIQQALSDPCALHTTLYAASAHVDAFRGAKNNYMTLYHHTIALRLLQEKISDPDATFSESLLACVAPLVFFSALLGDKGSSQIHKIALMQMIKAQGGLEHLTLGPFLSGLITVCILTEAIIMDSTLDIPFLDIPPTPLMPPTYLTSAILRRATSRKGGYYNLSSQTIEIFEEIDVIAHVPRDDPTAIEIRTKWANRLQDLDRSSDVHDGQNNNDDPSIESDADAITQSCLTAALIFWYLFLEDEYSSPSQMAGLQILVRRLQYALSRGSMDTWVRSAPEAHTWICLLGTAAALDLNDRVWFSLRHGQPVICIETKGSSVFLESWRMYDWANRRRKEMMVGEEEGIVSGEREERETREED